MRRLSWQGQEEYIDSLFGLWIDTACVKDVTRPTYYITTGNGLDSAAIADGYRYFLVNPQDSVYSAVKGDDDKYTSKTNEGSCLLECYRRFDESSFC